MAMRRVLAGPSGDRRAYNIAVERTETQLFASNARTMCLS